MAILLDVLTGQWTAKELAARHGCDDSAIRTTLAAFDDAGIPRKKGHRGDPIVGVTPEARKILAFYALEWGVRVEAFTGPYPDAEGYYGLILGADRTVRDYAIVDQAQATPAEVMRKQARIIWIDNVDAVNVAAVQEWVKAHRPQLANIFNGYQGTESDGVNEIGQWSEEAEDAIVQLGQALNDAIDAGMSA